MYDKTTPGYSGVEVIVANDEKVRFRVMGKVHELLAVEGSLKNQAEKTRGDLLATFEKKRHLFTEKMVTFTSNEDGTPAVREEQLDLQSTVRKELTWVSGIWAKALDVAYHVAEANTQARADVMLDDGTVVLRNVPATALLELEKRAMEIHGLVQHIPTLDPAKGFVLDADRGKDIYKARDDTKTRTRKIQRPLVLTPATVQHPAQVTLVSEDVPVGSIQTQEWSGLIAPAEKAEMLDRAERLHRAFKSARSRANSIEAGDTPQVGAALLKFVFG